MAHVMRRGTTEQVALCCRVYSGHAMSHSVVTARVTRVMWKQTVIIVLTADPSKPGMVMLCATWKLHLIQCNVALAELRAVL